MAIARNFHHLHPNPVKREWALVRFGVLIPFLAILSLTVGCVSTMRAQSSRPVRVEPLDIILQTDAASFGLANLGVFPFMTPHYAVGAGKEVTDFYLAELLRVGMFRQLTLIPHFVKTDEEAVWWGRRQGCDLVMKSEITYLMDGSGGMPTHLQTSIRIIDVRSGMPRWNLRQKAYSEPGPDVDLVWTTISGSPAQRYRLLARSLAEQLSEYFNSSAASQAKTYKK